MTLTAPDVLLLELPPDVDDGFRVLSAVRHASPGTRTLLLNDDCSDDLLIESIRRGACGCLSKSSDASLYAKAVRAAHAGETWFGRLALLQAVQSLVLATQATALADEDKLTRREAEILRFIGSGLTNKEIARCLAISDMTVKTHLHHIYVKLHRSGRYKAYHSQRIVLPAAGEWRGPQVAGPSVATLLGYPNLCDDEATDICSARPLQAGAQMERSFAVKPPEAPPRALL